MPYRFIHRVHTNTTGVGDVVPGRFMSWNGFFTFAFEYPCKAIGLKLDIILIVLFTFLEMC